MAYIVLISGTSRPNNNTVKAVRIVENELQNIGISAELVDARDLKMNFPGYDRTEDAVKLSESVSNSSGVVLATPEYHGSFSAMIKLIIENLGHPSALKNKPVALLGVASGRIGAVKSIEQLRGVCSHVGGIVIPGAVSISAIHQVFDEAGNCVDSAAEAALRNLAGSMTNFIKDYVCPKYMLEEIVREDSDSWSASV